MAERKQISRLSMSARSSELHLFVGGVPFSLDRDLLASRCSKLAALFKNNSHEDIIQFIREFPADAEIFELVARFCHGFQVQMCTENVVPIICAAFYLGMTESHSKNNLLTKAAAFFEQRVLPSWDETIKAFRVTEKFLQITLHLGVFDACLESLAEKVLSDHRLLGEPLKFVTDCDDSEDGDDHYKPNARRKLFDLDRNEDIALLSLRLYEPVIHRMSQRGVPSEYIASSVCQYAKNWVFSCDIDGASVPVYKRNSQRELVEALEQLLPPGTGLLPITFLFKMLRYAIACEATVECRAGFETRIGRQLEQATVKDLLIPSQVYAKEVQYDVESVRRILKSFYSSQTGSSDISRLITVAELVEDFLAEVASDIDLKINTFVSLAEVSAIASSGTHRNADGIYRAVDIYLDKHRFLTQHEKEEVCRVLDCQKMSPEALEHAARNERLPMRVVVQVLFEVQLQMRDTTNKDVKGFPDKMRRKELEKDDKEEDYDTRISYEEEGMRTELEKMSLKVRELEKECCLIKKEIASVCNENKMKKEKVTIWREVKRKLGCMTSINDSNCQVKKKKKVHPKFNISN